MNNVRGNPTRITRLTASTFNVTRETASNHIKALIREGLLSATGNTKARAYQLATLLTHVDQIAVNPKLEEHITWRETIAPYLRDMKDNVLAICQHGVMEMVNNVVSHSKARTMRVGIVRNPVLIQISVFDDGIGVFRNIQQTFGYDDPRHALLELAKGKLTSNPIGHSGEGIFFTSKMFDDFSIYSGELFYARLKRGADWLVEVEDRATMQGTSIMMEIHPESDRTTKEVFDLYSSGENRDFSKTHVPILLAKYEKEQLLSRSQARRVLARFERFSEVMLDFQGVEMIGQAFADEIFRVFQREQPGIAIGVFNASDEITQMIKHVTEDANGSLRLL